MSARRTAGAIVFDMDETILRRSRLGRLAVYIPGVASSKAGLDLIGQPLPGAVEALRRLAEAGHPIHAVTARWEPLARSNTEKWLVAHKLEVASLSMPSYPLHNGDAMAEWKSKTIRGIPCDQLLAGVGDRESDVRAYGAAGAKLVVGMVHESAFPGRSAERLSTLAKAADGISARTLLISDGEVAPGTRKEGADWTLSHDQAPGSVWRTAEAAIAKAAADRA